MGLTSRHQHGRPHFIAGACVLVLAATGCSATEPESEAGRAAPPPRSASPDAGARIDGASQQRLVDALAPSLACVDRDDYRDDLTFWDEMRGFDCVDGAATVTVRAYGSIASVDQMLSMWSDVLVDGRIARRGAHWFIIGPAERIASVKPPSWAPEFLHAPIAAPALTNEQEFLTNCAQYSYDEAVRMIRDEHTSPADRKYYEAAFAGVASAVRKSVSAEDLRLLRTTPDEDRWASMLSAHGPAWKRTCRAALEGTG